MRVHVAAVHPKGNLHLGQVGSAKKAMSVLYPASEILTFIS